MTAINCMDSFEISGTIADVVGGSFFEGTVRVRDGVIDEVVRNRSVDPTLNFQSAPHPFIFPGFVDSHVHIESSMLAPAEFARLAVVHGSVATVSDPHEIANVLGAPGCEYMVQSGSRTPLKVAWGVPSCVPATAFETAGATLDSAEVAKLLSRPEFYYLSEMMNFPGVLARDPEVMAKIDAAVRMKKPVDGHAPGLRGEALNRYIQAGIATDHESFTYDEGREKLELGMKLLIREGSAAKNFDALIPLLSEYPDSVMFCSDDKHPHDLIEGHLDRVLARALAIGIDPMVALRALSLAPVRHYRLPCGLLQRGDPADFILLEDLKDCRVSATFIKGRRVASHGETLLPHLSSPTPNAFQCMPVMATELRVTRDESATLLRVIGARDGQLVTDERHYPPRIVGGAIESDPARDILKLVVVNRYHQAPPAVGFIQGFGLQEGALASSVAHDSHNIVAVGSSDELLAAAINLVVEARGGVALASPNDRIVLPLPIAGLMSNGDGYEVGRRYAELDEGARRLGSALRSPFMTLSFMALLVIPALKLSDRGLFDGERFQFVPAQF